MLRYANGVSWTFIRCWSKIARIYGTFFLDVSTLTTKFILALPRAFVKQTQMAHSPNSPAAERPFLSPIIILIIGVLATSTSAILVRFAQREAPSLVIASGRLTLSTLLLLPWALSRRSVELRRLPGRGWQLALLSGFMLGLHFAAYIASLAYTSIAAATVLATSTPIWVALSAPLLLKEPLTRRLAAGIVLALSGSLLIGLEDSGIGTQPLLGNALALSSALTGAVYLLIGRHLRPRLSLVSYTTIVYGCAALTLLLLTVIAGQRLTGYSASVYILFFLMALFPQILGHSSYNYALRFLPAAYVSVAIISEPIGASILGLFIFREVPGALAVLGGALILGGIVLASRRREHR